MKTIKAFLLVLVLGVSGLASATDVPASLLVDRGGAEWAWASPCSPVDPSCGTALVMHDGFVIATAADFAASFSGFQDLYDAFNPVTGQLCASSYFNSGYSHCDNDNVNPAGGNVRVWNAPAAWGANSQDSFAEAFVVRGAAVPETGSLWLIGLGLAALSALRARKFRA